MSDSKIHSCIYAGRVRHRRRAPVDHAFSYRLFMMYLDLDELETVFRGRGLWSAHRPAPAWFDRRDHMGSPEVPLATVVRDEVERRTGKRPEGPIRLLTHLRYFGFCFNPVSLYFCFDARGESLECVVAEVNNTPWGERHAYVLSEDVNTGGERDKRYRVAKEMHVSPFMEMDMEYVWRLLPPGERLSVHIENHAAEKNIFDATLVLERREITSSTLARVLWSYPWMTMRVVAAIHWQALRLWLKGCPFVPHPRKKPVSAAGES